MDDPTPAGAPVLFLCIGNTLRRDDGAGWAVADRLDALAASSPALAGRMRVVRAFQLLPEHAVELARARLAVIVDAEVARGSDPPRVRIRPVPEDDGGGGLHALSPAGLRDLARRACGAAPELLLCGIPAVDFGYGETLGPAAARGVEEAVRLLRELL